MSHKVILPSRTNKLDELKSDLGNHGLNTGNAKQALMQAAVKSEQMAGKGCRYIENITNGRKKDWIKNFNNNTLLRTWFGKVDRKGQVKKVRNRMRSVSRRINKGLKIRLRPQGERTSNARNEMGHFSARKFMVFPKIFKNGIDTDKIASIYIHELVHLWFTDQKLNGEKVYDSDTAKQLARENPKSARKSAENYERFCIDLWS